MLLKLAFKVKYDIVLSYFFWSEGNHQLFYHKIPPEAAKILQFYSDLSPFGALLEEINLYPTNLRDFRYTKGKLVYRGQWVH